MIQCRRLNIQPPASNWGIFVKKRAFTFYAEHRSTLRFAIGCLIFGAAYALFTIFTGIGIPCIFRLLTGYHCPGCGISRFFLHMIHLDFIGAVSQNLAVAIIFPGWVLLVLIEFFCNPAWLEKDSHFLKVLQILACVLLILFGVIRNLPGCEWLLPT